MATEAEFGKVISPTYLIELYKMGFRKLVPMSKNDSHIGIPVIKDGIPVIEDGKQKYSWTPLYENPHHWTEERLVKQSVDFKNGVGVCLGDIGLEDEQGILYHNMLDIDSNAVYDKLLTLMNPGPKCSLVKRMFEQGCVVKTRKPKGRHIHWLSHKLYKPIRIVYCKEGSEFEIKTGKWCAPLPPTAHRVDTNFHYNWESKSVRGIPVSDDFYDIVLEVLKDFLKEKTLDDYQKTKEESKQDSDSNEQKQKQKQDSTNGSKQSGNGKVTGLELNEEDVKKITKPIQPYYIKGCSNVIVFSLSGVLCREGIAKEYVIEVIEKLANNDGISQKTDIQKAISQVERVFQEDERVDD
jgi:hypothetical protein